MLEICVYVNIIFKCIVLHCYYPLSLIQLFIEIGKYYENQTETSYIYIYDIFPGIFIRNGPQIDCIDHVFKYHVARKKFIKDTCQGFMLEKPWLDSVL